MDAPVWMEIEDLRKLKTGALRAKFREVFRAESRSSNREFLFRRIAWRLQACAEGDLTERARRRAAEVANDADLRARAPRSFAAELSGLAPARRPRLTSDSRLPPVGTVLQREYRNQLIQVQVRADGFEYRSRAFRSLSAIAREVTGTRWNGFLFFGLTERRRG
jgi:hypothetical protein